MGTVQQIGLELTKTRGLVLEFELAVAVVRFQRKAESMNRTGPGKAQKKVRKNFSFVSERIENQS